MPRIYAPREVSTLAGATDFVNGAAAVAEDAADAIALFTAAGCVIDNSKHELTELDKLPRAVVDNFCEYLGTALTPGDGKFDVIRDIEASLSAKYITALTVTSVAHGTTVGNSVVTVTTAKSDAANKHYYKVSDAALTTVLYGDEIDSTWTEFTSAAAAGLAVTNDKYINVAEAAGDFIIGFGSVQIDSKV